MRNFFLYFLLEFLLKNVVTNFSVQQKRTPSVATSLSPRQAIPQVGGQPSPVAPVGVPLQPQVLQPQVAQQPQPVQATAKPQILQATAYQDPSAAANKASRKSSKTKTTKKSKKSEKSSEKLNLPDGIEISWRKPPPPQEVQEAMKYLQPKKNPQVSQVDTAPTETLVSCPFCKGQFADVSEHMDHCPVIIGNDSGNL